MKILFKFAGLLCLVALLAVPSCAPQKDQAVGKAGDEGQYEFEKEGEVGYGSGDRVVEETDFEEIPLAEDNVVGEEVEAPRDTTSAGATSPGGISGAKTGAGPVSGIAGKDGGSMTPVFRVQVVAVSDETSAQDARQTAELRLKLPAYVEFVDGMYKVRVGDCQTRVEAEKVLRRCRESGYPDAWIVTGHIKVGPDGKRLR